ncbi:P-loop containing nucleoside triphosphate hydrolase [Pseudocohnilembus persalinus]|uniref:p-loop containing nucleoside triphosphate hydrolase n=1 Tax=Pseudocohnilembus persalinus TaxID=266149 RepID=A0A0V0QL07_PSEPJ|nr:P-loop containing nucleoside triphosphate hydrolase [Pseudocohnilembus persalinus]|eukprot:KRX02991.1 P-loop containing nucleoside triphosphate hydrolase [Pseudocohnilembus persalinus]
MSECVKVIVRCRPLNQREKDLNSVNVIQMNNKLNQVSIKRNVQNDIPKVFTFDAVFDVDSKQDDVYEQSAFPLVEQVFEGYNGTMFAYGQTGCGKSFTMMGLPKDQVLKGVIPRTFEHIFNIINSDETSKTFLVMCAYMEIYNEEVRDLLSVNHHDKLDLKEDPNKGVYVKGLNKIVVKSVKEMDDLMDKGNHNRSVGATAMNAVSSRSHSIFTIFIETQEKVGQEESFKTGKLNLVDLAGSEKQSKTQAEGARLKEATKINLSLSALGNVISALSSGKGGHIPYRDSKLTRLLQDSLGGNTKTIMMAALSPADDNYDETVSTLRYAARAKTIKNKPVVNMDPKDALLKEYQDEINRLKQMLANGGQLPPNELPQIAQQMSLNPEKQIIYKEMNEGQNGKMDEKLKEKEQALQDEINQRKNLEDLVKKLEQNQMHGGQKEGEENEQQKKYKELRQKLKKQKKQQEKLKEQQQKKDEELIDMEKQYKSMEDEVQAARKIKDLYKKKIEYLNQEIKDLENEHEIEKEDLLETIRQQNKDSLLNQVIIDMLLAPREFAVLKNAAVWKEDQQTYTIPPFTFKQRKVYFPKLQHHQAQELMEQEKENRDIDFENSQQNNYSQQQQQSTQHTNKTKSNVGYKYPNQNSVSDNFDYEMDSDPMYNDNRGRNGKINNIKISKMSTTRQKFYSANPASRNFGNDEDQQAATRDKTYLNKKLQPMSDQAERLELAKQSQWKFLVAGKKKYKKQKRGPTQPNKPLAQYNEQQQIQSYVNKRNQKRQMQTKKRLELPLGVIPYGRVLKGQAQVSNPFLGCHSNDQISNGATIIIADSKRDCSWSQKAQIAVNQGAQLLILVENTDADIFHTNYNAYNIQEINIPVIMISKKDGNILVNALKENHEKLFFRVKFPALKKSESVKIDYFMHAAEYSHYPFIFNFQALFNTLLQENKQISFNPRIPITQNLESKKTGFSNKNDKCLGGGRYCYLQSPNQITHTEPQEALKIDVLSICAYQYDQQQWFEVMIDYNSKCGIQNQQNSSQNNQLVNCFFDIIKQRNPKAQNFIKNCYYDQKDPEIYDITVSEHSLLNAQYQHFSSSHMQYAPSLLVNNQKILGNINSKFDMYSGICSAFDKDNYPQICHQFLGYTPQDFNQTTLEQHRKSKIYTVFQVIFLGMITLFIIFCVFRICQKRKVHSELQQKIYKAVNKYGQFENETN